MKEERDLDQLLAADREHLQRVTRQAVVSGLVQRVSAAAMIEREPRLPRYSLAALAAAAAMILMVIAVSRRIAGPSLPLPVTAAHAIPAPAFTAPLIHRTGVPAPPRAIARQRDYKPKIRCEIRRYTPFPTPTPLSPEERTLMLIAQSGTQEKLLVLAQQQQLNEDFVNGVRQFQEKIQQQEGKPQ